jgi:hypothetical protein
VVGHDQCQQAAPTSFGPIAVDATASGKRMKCPTIVDEFTHECPAIDVGARSAPGA